MRCRVRRPVASSRSPSRSRSVPCRASATYFSGDKLVLAVSGAREINEADAPQLMNVVREMAIAANVPMPTRPHHRGHGPERVRDRARSGPRLDRDHDRAAREARPRGAPGRDRPRAVARPQPRHPLLVGGRGDGRRDRDPGRLLPALHVLGRRQRSSSSAKGGNSGDRP